DPDPVLLTPRLDDEVLLRLLVAAAPGHERELLVAAAGAAGVAPAAARGRHQREHRRGGRHHDRPSRPTHDNLPSAHVTGKSPGRAGTRPEPDRGNVVL